MTDNAKAEIERYVSDMIATENHILTAVNQQLEDDAVKKHAKGEAVIRKVKTTLERHVSELRDYLKSIGGDESSFKTLVGNVSGFMAGLYDRLRGQVGATSRHLRDDYTALSLASASYTLLNATGHTLGDPKIADLAKRHLKDLAPLVIEISRTLPHVVSAELVEDHDWAKPAPGAADQSERETHEAWVDVSSSGSSSSSTTASTGTRTV